MTPQEIKAVLDAAEVRVTEATALFRIAHTTWYDWLNGVTKPKNQMMYEHAERIARLIAKAYRAGYLPLRDVKPKERMKAVEVALSRVSNA